MRSYRRNPAAVQRTQYSTVQYSTVQYSTVQYSTVQYSTVQYTHSVLRCTSALKLSKVTQDAACCLPCAVGVAWLPASTTQQAL